MAHYDCSNCGASMGISFGMCESCTPRAVTEAELTEKVAWTEAEQEWRRATDSLRKEFLLRRTAAAREEAKRVWNHHAPEHLRKS